MCPRRGDVVYDIGANVAAYLLLVASLGDGACHVVAFEPSCFRFANLARNIHLNELGAKITPFEIALSDRT